MNIHGPNVVTNLHQARCDSGAALAQAISPFSGALPGTLNTPTAQPSILSSHQLSLSKCSYTKPFRSLRIGLTSYLPPVPLFILPPYHIPLGKLLLIQ